MKRVSRILAWMLSAVTRLSDLSDHLRPWQRRLLMGVGYTVFTVACFVLFLVLTFPMDPIRAKIVRYAEDELKLDVKMDSLSSALPLGVKAKGVHITSKDESDTTYPLDIPYLRVTLNPLPLLFGRQSVAFNSDIFGGSLGGHISLDKKNDVYGVDLDMDRLKLDEISSIKNRFKELPIKGTLSMRGDVTLNMKEPKNSKGYLDVHMKDGVVGPGKFGAEIPQIRTGTLDARFVMDKGNLEIEKYTQNSPDMQSDAVGHITFQKNFGSSRVNIDWRFRFADELVQKSELFKMALSLWRNAEGPDKYFYYNLRGTLAKMQPPVPNRAAASRFGKGAKPDAEGAKSHGPKAPGVNRPGVGDTATPAAPAAPSARQAPTPPPSEMPPPPVPPTPIAPSKPSDAPKNGGIRETRDDNAEGNDEAQPAEDDNNGNDDAKSKHKGKRRRNEPNDEENNDGNANANEPAEEN